MPNVKDGATSTVATAPVSATAGTSLIVAAGEGVLYPPTPFYAIAHPNNVIPTVSVSEKILVTGISTDTLTIVRAQGIYGAKSIAVGWRISNAIFQDDLNNASMIRNEVPGGTINGSNTAFTTASPAATATGSLSVFKNGVRMKPGGADFTQTTTGFTMVTAPATGTVLLVDYIVAGALNNVGTNSLVTVETPTGSVNSSNTAFTTARAYIASSLEVFVNGLKQLRGTDYTETTPGSGVFTMAVAPVTGDAIFVDYQFNLNPASNADTVDGIHANTTATANMLMPLDANAKISSALLSDPYKFSVYRSAASASSNAFLKVDHDTTVFDTGGNTTGSDKFIAPVGLFMNFTATAGNTVAGATAIFSAIYKNGVQYMIGGGANTAPNGGWNNVNGIIQLAAADYIEHYFIGGNGSTMEVGQARCYFQGWLHSLT